MADKSSPASKEEAANRSNQSGTAEPMTASAYRMERGGPPKVIRRNGAMQQRRFCGCLLFLGLSFLLCKARDM